MYRASCFYDMHAERPHRLTLRAAPSRVCGGSLILKAEYIL